VDYITMQPMMSYYPGIYRARHGEDEEPNSWWWDRLSRFSKWVVGSCLGFLILLFVWSFFSSRFSQANYLVFCATLFQAYALLSIVHWNHNRDISTDALIKLFASGFCLSTTIAVFFELVVGLTIRLVMSILMAMSGIDVIESNGFTLASPGFGNFWNAMQETGEGSASYHDYLHVFGRDHPFVYTIYLFINAFLLAATIEELSKYFGFRMVEHPDFLSRRDLQEAAECYIADNDNDEEEDQEEHSFPEQDRSLQSRGAAITVSMVAVSLGFACCENLIYIFVYGESTLAVEVVILLARSLFPVHPIAAALQSIGVCQRDLEKQEKMTLGRLVFPGILFHGLYDFFLMWIDFMGNRNANYATDDDESDIPSVSNSDAYSVVVSLFILMFGLWYYLRQSRRQRERLKAMDQARSVDQSNLL
jgi:RsiW-degrading membrane proteinase PrsW (M82 family)